MIVQGSAAMQFKSQTAMKLKEQGNQMFAEHKFNEAIDLYSKALQVALFALALEHSNFRNTNMQHTCT